MPPLAIMAGIGAAGSIGGALIGSNAAGNAADTQANAAIQAAQIQANEADKALGFQEQQYATGQQELAPWLMAGNEGLANLENLMGLPVSGNATIPGVGPATMEPRGAGTQLRPEGFTGSQFSRFRTGGPIVDGTWRFADNGGTPISGAGTGTPGTNGIPSHLVSMASLINPALGAKGSLNFQSPTAITEQNDPGYQARLQLGTDAIQRSAAASGGVLSGGTARALDTYAQDYASNEYQNVYNRALTNNMTLYNRLASMAGLGQQTGSTLVGAGNNSANSIANTLMTLGELQGQAYNNAGAARASGYVGGANAWSGALGNLGSYASLIPMLQLLQQQNGGAIPSMDPNLLAAELEKPA